MIELNSITKKFGDKVAVDSLSFKVGEGEIVGFLGPNGAGKSTTMNIITGYLSATSGSAVINGSDIFEDADRAKKNIGFLPEQPPLYLDMTVLEYLGFVYDLKKVKKNKKAHIDEICSLVGIENVKKRVIKNLSKGYRQRVGIAEALIGDPKVLIFDEPTVGLDPNQIIEIRALIKNLGKKHTVILSTHILSEVQAVCDRIIIINKGKIVADSKAEELLKNTSGKLRHKVKLGTTDEREAVKILSSLDGVTSVAPIKTDEANTVSLIVESDPSIDIRKPLFSLLAGRSIAIMGLENVSLTLEDIFTSLTKKGEVK